LKIEICMWNVWNLTFWELKCLNWDVWILKAKNWNFYVKHFEFENLKLEMFEFGCVNIENKKVWSKHVVHMGIERYNIICSHKCPHKVIICFEPSKPK
jgi:hypothetical protein